jgi:hypothetical protein
MRESEAGGEIEGPPAATAQYVASVTAELAKLARRNGLETLGYILDMAKLEADQISESAVRISRVA